MRAALKAPAFAVLCALLALGCSDDSSGKKPTTYSTMKPPPQGWKAAVGDGGTLLETFDESSWDVRKVTDHDLYAVSCIDNEVGWTVGAQGFIGNTRDGGWSWPAQDSGVSAALRAVSFAVDSDGDEVGLAVGDAATLLGTRDGGKHWTRIQLAGRANLRGTAVTEGASLLVAVGDGGWLARSTDFGRTFDESRLDDAGVRARSARQRARG